MSIGSLTLTLLGHQRGELVLSQSEKIIPQSQTPNQLTSEALHSELYFYTTNMLTQKLIVIFCAPGIACSLLCGRWNCLGESNHKHRSFFSLLCRGLKQHFYATIWPFAPTITDVICRTDIMKNYCEGKTPFPPLQNDNYIVVSCAARQSLKGTLPCLTIASFLSSNVGIS